jgi:hypothetical protein
MRRVFFVAAFFFLHAASALGFCGPPRLICAEYASSAAVVEAKLIDSKHYFPKNDEEQDWHIYTLEVLKSYKGELNGNFHIREYNDSGRAGFYWKKGESYLLFLKRSEDGTWRVYGCGNSNLLRKSTRTIEIIESLGSRLGGVIQGSIAGMPLGPNKTRVVLEEKERKEDFTGKVDENGLFKFAFPPDTIVCEWSSTDGSLKEIDLCHTKIR